MYFVSPVLNVMLQKASIEIDDDGSYLQIENDGRSKKLEKAKITLNDCLACR